jgi:hypothetical protein
MLRKISQLNDVIFNLRHGISYDLKPYRKILEDINSFELRTCSDARIKEMARTSFWTGCSCSFYQTPLPGVMPCCAAVWA